MKHTWSIAAALIPVVAACALAESLPGQDTAGRASVAADLAEAAAALAREDAPAALRHLDRVAISEPLNPWMLYYRGAALLLLRKPYDAMSAFDAADDRLLELGDPDPALRDRIAEHRRLARRQVFALDLELGLAYSTNVTFTGAGAQEVGLISGRSDGSVGALARWSFAPVATDADLLAVSIQTAQMRQFKVEEFDYQDYGLSLGYAHRWSEDWESSIAYVYDFSVLERDSYLSNHALILGLDRHWTRRDTWLRSRRTGVFYRLEGRDFLLPTGPEFDRDGVAHAVGIEHAVQLQPSAHVPWICDLSAGYVFESVHTEGREFDRQGHDFFLRCGAPLLNPADPSQYLLIPDQEARLEFDALWELDRYRHGSLFDRERRHRRDLLTTLSLRFSQLLRRDVRYGDITLRAIISWSDSDSNVRTRDAGTPFSYDRMFYGLQIAWSW